MIKIKPDEMFLEWFKQTNPHLYKKGVTKKEQLQEITEYVNDVLQEHMEQMNKYTIDTDEEEGQDYEEL